MSEKQRYGTKENMEQKSANLKKLGISVRGIANWILDYADSLNFSVTNMALNKLVYFAYEKVLLEKGEILTNAKIEAWEHGPVFREVYQDFKRFGDKAIVSRAQFFSIASGGMEVAICDLDDQLEEYLKTVVRPLLPLSASRLRGLSHAKGGAWEKAWSYDGNSNPGMEITPSLILDSVTSQGEH